MQPTQADQLLSVREAAVLLDTSPATIRRWVTEGKVPALRLGSGPASQLRLRATDICGLLTRAGPRGER